MSFSKRLRIERDESLMNRSQLAQIHILKKEANLNDEAYRDLLFASANVRSAADIDGRASFDRVISALLKAAGKSGNVKDIVIRPKQKLDLAFSFSTPSVPWTWYDATPEQWEKHAYLIELAEKKGWSMVAVWGADGSKKFKMKYNPRLMNYVVTG